jgi:hypothetical protein
VLALLEGLRLMLAALAAAAAAAALFAAGVELLSTGAEVALSFVVVLFAASFLTFVVVVAGEGEAEGEASVMAMMRKRK